MLSKEDYKKELLNHLELARKNIVWYILKTDWYVDWTNDVLVKKIDKFINYFN